jgi:hypothetical protein
VSCAACVLYLHPLRSPLLVASWLACFSSVCAPETRVQELLPGGPGGAGRSRRLPGPHHGPRGVRAPQRQPARYGPCCRAAVRARGRLLAPVRDFARRCSWCCCSRL